MKKYFLIHPLFFALIPILALYNSNKQLLNFHELVLPLFLALLLTFVFFLIFKLITKNFSKAVLLTTAFLIIFFFFSRLSEIFTLFLSFFKVSFLHNLANYLALVFFILIIVVVSYLVSVYRKSFKNLHKYLFYAGLFLLLSFSVGIISYCFASYDEIELDNKVKFSQNNLKSNSYPDIYYLVFDGHARSDILKELYNYNNQEFINYLKSKGFFVAEESRANYPQTYLSMSSALNLSYLDNVGKNSGKESKDRGILLKLIEKNKVYELLENFNYSFVSVNNPWRGARKNRVDINLVKTKDLSDFNFTLLKSTPLKFFLIMDYTSKYFKNRVLATFDSLPKVASIEENTFVYAHTISPHPPFLFTKNGELKDNLNLASRDGSHYFETADTTKEGYRQGYLDQLHFIDQKIKQTVDSVLAQYPQGTQQPIIIIQSDHGPGMMTDWKSMEKTNLDERFSILNAYYVPEDLKAKLYDSITPVNTFRLLFNHLFDQKFELLEDKSYFATWEQPFNFTDVTERLKQ